MEEFSQDLSVALEEANQQDSDSCIEQVMQKPRRPRRRRVRKGCRDLKGVDMAGATGLGGHASPASHSDGGDADGPSPERAILTHVQHRQQQQQPQQHQPHRTSRVKRNQRMQVDESGCEAAVVVMHRACQLHDPVSGDVDMTLATTAAQGADAEEDCNMEGAFLSSSSLSDLPSECGGCCGCSSEADDEQTDFPHSEPPPPKMAALLVNHPMAANRATVGGRCGPGPGGPSGAGSAGSGGGGGGGGGGGSGGSGGGAGGDHGRHSTLGSSGPPIVAGAGHHHFGGLPISIGHHHVASHLVLTNEFRRRVHSAGNRASGGCSEPAGGRKRRRRCCPLLVTASSVAAAASVTNANLLASSPSMSIDPAAGSLALKLAASTSNS